MEMVMRCGGGRDGCDGGDEMEMVVRWCSDDGDNVGDIGMVAIVVWCSGDGGGGRNLAGGGAKKIRGGRSESSSLALEWMDDWITFKQTYNKLSDQRKRFERRV
ncbi:hypothetical protein Tco_1492822 [Tanacetum coccineum]